MAPPSRFPSPDRGRRPPRQVQRQTAEGISLPRRLGVLCEHKLNDLPPIDTMVAARGMQRVLEHLVALAH